MICNGWFFQYLSMFTPKSYHINFGIANYTRYTSIISTYIPSISPLCPHWYPIDIPKLFLHTSHNPPEPCEAIAFALLGFLHESLGRALTNNRSFELSWTSKNVSKMHGYLVQNAKYGAKHVVLEKTLSMSFDFINIVGCVFGCPIEVLTYPLVNVYITMERSTIFNGKIHYFYGHVP